MVLQRIMIIAGQVITNSKEKLIVYTNYELFNFNLPKKRNRTNIRHRLQAWTTF